MHLQHDSGSPLICERDGRVVQEGIVGHAVDTEYCAGPGQFARVSAYIDWINAQMEALEVC